MGMQIMDLGVLLHPAAVGPKHSGHDGEPITSDWVKNYVNSHSKELIVGVEQWFRVQAVRTNGSILLTAKIRTVDVVEGGLFDGQKVTPAWIEGYILGAAEFWMAPGCVKAEHVRVTLSDPS